MNSDVVDAFSASATDDSMLRLAEHFASGDASANDVAHLAIVLARSGEVLPRTGQPSVDIASTGGPGSLTTLLAPLFASAIGATVSKIGVPGRPAGGLDVLGATAGYALTTDLLRAREILAECGYLHGPPRSSATVTMRTKPLGLEFRVTEGGNRPISGSTRLSMVDGHPAQQRTFAPLGPASVDPARDRHVDARPGVT